MLIIFILCISGILISIFSTKLQCSKVGFGNVTQGLVSAILPSGIYYLASMFPLVRTPFTNTLISFGVPPDRAEVVGIAYLVMLASWVSTVWNIHASEKSVCVATADEMTKFKQDMLAQLQKKQEETEKNKETK